MVSSGVGRRTPGVERAPFALLAVALGCGRRHAAAVSVTAVAQLALIVAALLLLCGCASLAPVVEALGHDASSACVTVSTPYGTAAAIRTNRDGARCTASGGQCSCETPGGK
jgi:hypothetical protein